MSQVINSISTSELIKGFYKEIMILGNGPSLKRLDFKNIQSELIICCNWIFQHKHFDLIDSRSILCFSDPAFSNMNVDSWLVKLLKNRCIVLIPSFWERQIKWIETKTNIKGRVFTYELEGSYKDYKQAASKNNMERFPKVHYTSSVMTTICLPLANRIKTNEIRISGLDATYFSNGKFDPYFFKLNSEHQYRHTKDQAETWSTNLNNELHHQFNIIKSNGKLIDRF